MVLEMKAPEHVTVEVGAADEVETLADLDAVTARHADRYARFRETFCSLEDGHATERVLDLIFPADTVSTGTATTRGGDDSAHR